jgi:phenylalanyl-tRNA synthetase beta chain
MIGMLARNLNRDVREARLFEQGTTFAGMADDGGAVYRVTETHSLALGLTGDLPAARLHSAKDAGIFELRGAVESLLSLFAVSMDSPMTSAAEAVVFSANVPAWIEPGRGATALLGESPLACFGELASTQREARKLRQPVYLAEINLGALYALPLRRPAARELSRFQAVERDFSFTFTDSIHWQAVAQAVKALQIPELTRLAPVEIFRDAKGSSVPTGHYALLLRCIFQSIERTLHEDELTEWSAKIIAALTLLGGAIRA